MESRKYFVEQVASTIVESHGKEPEDSFIFGISGKWGEGKTTFLKDLEKEVKIRDKSFVILWVNPWKFVSDKISFLRSFLAQLPTPKLNRVNTIRAFFRNPTELRDLYFDVSKDVIDWRILVLLGLYLLLGFIYYFFWRHLIFVNDIIPLIPQGVIIFFQLLGASFLIPIVLAVFKSVSTYQQGSKTISTLDRFEDLLKLRLQQNSDTKFLIYIDDLDRVTPTVARDVLDNLRTFFDKPQLSFIVAGDHTVLERYIGKELLPGENQSPAQLEEGRRYLKKIFNVYWRLPPPIANELKNFIENDLFVPSKSDLGKIFHGANADTERQKLASVLARYFDGNFRQIIRFFEMVRFTFKIIEKKKAAVSAQEKPYFEELTQYPLLVIRILMIQENCTPLFEAMLRDPEVLLSLEDAVENKNTSLIQKTLDKYKLSENQRAFIEKFLFEEPRFYKDSSLVVSNLQPFLVLAADSSFGDGRGPSPEKFFEILNTGNPETVKNSILSSGESRLKEGSDNFVTQYNSRPVDAQRDTLLKTLITALLEVPGSHNSHAIFADKLKNLDFSFANTLPVGNRLITYQLIWSWLDSMEDQSFGTHFVSKFPPLNFDDFNQLQFDKAVGSFTTSRVVEWFKQFYSSQRNASYSRLLLNLSFLDKKAATTELQSIENEVIEDFAQNKDGSRDSAYGVMISLDRQEKVKQRVLERVQDVDQDFWNWINSKELDVLSLSKKDLEDSVIGRLDKTKNDHGTVFNVVNFAAGNNFTESSPLWERITKTSPDAFFANIAHFASTPLIQITPDKTHARALFSAVLQKVHGLDQSLQSQSLKWLKKDVWLWKNIDKPKDLKILKELSKSPNADVAREAIEILTSWEPPT